MPYTRDAKAIPLRPRAKPQRVVVNVALPRRRAAKDAAPAPRGPGYELMATPAERMAAYEQKIAPMRAAEKERERQRDLRERQIVDRACLTLKRLKIQQQIDAFNARMGWK
jgi:hypothetical protein